MATEPIAAALKTLRKKSGLSQEEIAGILGFASPYTVYSHERSIFVPSLLTALGYEVIFRVPVSQLFPGLYRTVEAVIERRLSELEDKLQQSTAKGREANIIAQKLEFCCERKNTEPIQANHETPDL